MLQQTNNKSVSGRSTSQRSTRRWGRSGQLQFEFKAAEETDAISLNGKASPGNIIRISQFCSDIIDATRPVRTEVPFKITAARKSSSNQNATMALKSIFG